MVPEVRPKPLYRADRKNFARLLGLDALPDACVRAIAWVIAAHKASREYMKRVNEHTPAKWEAALRRVKNQMQRGHDGPEITRWITDPLFGADVETFERLHGIVGDGEVPLERRLAAIEERRHELAALPEIDARYGLRMVLVAEALVWIWHYFAVDRDDTERQWQFARAILKAAGEEGEGVRKNPKRLERLKLDVERLMQLTAQPAGSG